MQKLRILYVASEIKPFLKSSNVAKIVRQLPQAMQEKGMEIRILVPRFGVINERKNRLHEVVRLSGINISVGDEERPLVIKVASIPSAKLQVYFIDNEDYFHRKAVFSSKEGEFFADNDERMVFFCKGVLETVKKLGWSPDIVHCNDWISSLIPLYLKTAYKKDPIFQNTKSIFTLYNNSFEGQLSENLGDMVKMLDLDEEKDLNFLKDSSLTGLLKTGMEYADVITKAEEEYSAPVQELLNAYDSNDKINATQESSEFSELYYELYNELANVS